MESGTRGLAPATPDAEPNMISGKLPPTLPVFSILGPPTLPAGSADFTRSNFELCLCRSHKVAIHDFLIDIQVLRRQESSERKTR